MVSIQKMAVGVTVLGALASVVSAQSFSTVFGPGGDAGLIVPDAGILNGIDSVATFGAANNGTGLFANTPNVGATFFAQIGAFYVGGAGAATNNPLSAQGLVNFGGVVVNNRAYGVINAGRSDITFTAGEVDELTIQVRGSANGQTTGTNPGTSFGGIPTSLFDAAGTVLVWTELGVEATLDISNADYQTFTLNASDFLGDSIIRLSLINEGPVDSVVLLGELTTTLVPAPGTVGFAASLGLAGMARRRRNEFIPHGVPRAANNAAQGGEKNEG